MKTWSRAHTLVLGLIILLTTNAIALVGVAWNRHGEPLSELRLTQRELSLPYRGGLGEEDGATALTFQWRVLEKERKPQPWFDEEHIYRNGDIPWLDQAKMVELGFDPQPRENEHGKLLSKEVLLALELNGPAYQTALERARQAFNHPIEPTDPTLKKHAIEPNEDTPVKKLEREENQNSRLFVVDAGLDLTSLKEKYPDRARYAIVRGRIRPDFVGKFKDRTLTGLISNLSVGEVTVPFAFRHIFRREPSMEAFDGNTKKERFTVTVAFGNRLEPWITGVTPEK